MAARGALLALLCCAALALALAASAEKHRHDDGLEVDALDFADGRDFDDFDLSDMTPRRRHRLSSRHQKLSKTDIKVRVKTKFGRSIRRHGRKGRKGRKGGHWKKWKKQHAVSRRRSHKPPKAPHRYSAQQRRVLAGFLVRLGKYVSKVPTITRPDLGTIVQKLADKHVHKTCKQDFRPALCLQVLQKFFFGDKNATHWSQKKALFLSGSHKFRANCCGASHCCVRETNLAAADSYQNTRQFKKNLEHMLGIKITRPKPKNPYKSAAKRTKKGKKGKKGKKVVDPEEKPYKTKVCKDVVRAKGDCKGPTTSLLNAFVRKLVRKASTAGSPRSDVDSNQLLALARLIAKERALSGVRRHKRSLQVRRKATKNFNIQLPDR